MPLWKGTGTQTPLQRQLLLANPVLQQSSLKSLKQRGNYMSENYNMHETGVQNLHTADDTTSRPSSNQHPYFVDIDS